MEGGNWTGSKARRPDPVHSLGQLRGQPIGAKGVGGGIRARERDRSAPGIAYPSGRRRLPNREHLDPWTCRFSRDRRFRTLARPYRVREGSSSTYSRLDDQLRLVRAVVLVISNVAAFRKYQVFMNYPYDEEFLPYSEALAFAIVATGLLPLCALDLTVPDRPRLQAIVEAIDSCDFSVHDLSRASGFGEENLARMNMPLEMGMALFHALRTQHVDHRCAFFVSDSHTYKRFASDLAGLDPVVYGDSVELLVAKTSDWLRSVAPLGFRSDVPTVEVVEAFELFRKRCKVFRGSGLDGRLTHVETREVMYRVCAEREWWDWRATRAGRDAFPEIPLATTTR